jgi:hypothetical protein
MEPSFLFNMLTRQKKKTDFNIKGYKSMDFDLFGPDYLIVEASMELILRHSKQFIKQVYHAH